MEKCFALGSSGKQAFCVKRLALSLIKARHEYPGLKPWGDEAAPSAPGSGNKLTAWAYGPRFVLSLDFGLLVGRKMASRFEVPVRERLALSVLPSAFRKKSLHDLLTKAFKTRLR